MDSEIQNLKNEIAQDRADRKRAARRNALLAVLGVLVVGGVAGAAAGTHFESTPWTWKGGVGINVSGLSTLVAVDAGNVRVQDTLVPISSEQDGGTGQMRLLSGYCVLSSNDCAITFNPAFAAIPDCTCASVNATAAACGVKAIPSASAVTFRGANASDPIFWSCHGAK